MTVHTQADPCDALLLGVRIALSEQASSTTIRLYGEWDLAGQQAARRAVRHALSSQPARVVLDLSGLTFIDSSGIHVVIDLVKRATRLKIELAIIPGSPAVQRIFEICGLNAHLPFTSPR
jgi:anti-sigma B factor antagonist